MRMFSTGQGHSLSASVHSACRLCAAPGGHTQHLRLARQPPEAVAVLRARRGDCRAQAGRASAVRKPGALAAQ
jgi:hypothetical protein